MASHQFLVPLSVLYIPDLPLTITRKFIYPDDVSLDAYNRDAIAIG